MFCHQLAPKLRGGRGEGPAVTSNRGDDGTVQQIHPFTPPTVVLLLLFIMATQITELGSAEKAIIADQRQQLVPASAARPRRHGQQRSAFDLVRLEQRLALTVQSGHLPADSRQSFKDDPDGSHHARSRGLNQDGGTQADAELVPADGCRQQCDEQLRMGLDMVKAHSAFGSIGVPSVIDVLDLQVFCRVDADHDACLLGCGYQVHFNMRDFVCKRKRKELISHLDCYKSAAPQLRRQCGAAQCGPYQELEHSLLGVSQRCRTLLCDTQCIRARLAQHSACRDGGRPAVQYLITYSQIQVLAWLRDLLGDASARPGGTFWRAMPRSCLRLICGQNGGNALNCTLPTAVV